jgi:hypothetical protein
MKMKNWLLIWITGAPLLTGCINPDGSFSHTGTGALAGGAIGAGTGAILGGRHHGGAAALIGGAVGALAGTAIGSSMDAEERSRVRAQAPQTYQRIETRQPLSVSDVKALSAARVNDDVIISQIRSTGTSFHLSSADIIDLSNSGVSQRVIEFMINTQGNASSAAPQPVTVAQAPPQPVVETVVVAPGPGYVWVGGEWAWRGGWVWVPGYWAWPPRPSAVWVGGYYYHGPRGHYYVRGYWR